MNSADLLLQTVNVAFIVKFYLNIRFFMCSLEVNLFKHEIQNTKTKLKVIKILFVFVSTSIPDRGLERIAQDK